MTPNISLADIMSLFWRNCTHSDIFYDLVFKSFFKSFMAVILVSILCINWSELLLSLSNFYINRFLFSYCYFLYFCYCSISGWCSPILLYHFHQSELISHFSYKIVTLSIFPKHNKSANTNPNQKLYIIHNGYLVLLGFQGKSILEQQFI